MTREEVYESCLQKLGNSNCLLLEAATGLGKSKIAIDLINTLVQKYEGKPTTMLLLVAKNVHKTTWKDEFEKWGGIKVDNVVIECYESLKKHTKEAFDFIVMDEVHHIKSDIRKELLSTIKFSYMLGLSATIPRDLKQLFKYKYKAAIVSCDITEAIEDDILPEPEIILWPLSLETTKISETIVLNPKIASPTIEAPFKDIWKWKKNKTIRVIIRCTQQQKMNELNSQISWMKDLYMRTRSKQKEQSWLYLCGKRLEFLADCKLQIVKLLLRKLRNSRTITFCKTIKQSEELGRNCIHSKKKNATDIYERFNQKKIHHITAVNILNENANLVDCRYAIFANLSSSEVIIPQRLGRAMRHKKPVIIVPYYTGTREEEIVQKMFANYNREFIRIIHSMKEL